MAWRIEDSVVRGEVDNRVRGRVTGRIWFAGRPEPIVLQLMGNGWPDLAGRRLEFINPDPSPGDLDGLAAFQEGTVGDFTASRKVKVPEIPMDQIGEYYASKKPFPWHWGNSLYLEWFSERNGRVVIESAGYNLKIIGEPAWELTREDEEAQRKANGAAIEGLVERLGETYDSDVEDDGFTGVNEDLEDDDVPSWAPKPLTEDEASRLQEESEKLVDRIQARIRREGDKADFARIMDEEISRLRHERGDPPPSEEQLARQSAWIDEMNRAANSAVGQPEPEEKIDNEHPLAAEAKRVAGLIMEETEDKEWMTEADSEEHPVAELVSSTLKASAKLAGALNHVSWPPPIEFCAHTVVRLTKARGYLDDAARAIESCQEQKLTEPAWLAEILREITALAIKVDEIVFVLRERLDRSLEQ